MAKMQKIYLLVEAEVCRDPDELQGHMHMGSQLFAANKEGKEIGGVVACMGGVLEFDDMSGEKTRSWHVRPGELWRAFQEAIVEHDAKEKTENEHKSG